MFRARRARHSTSGFAFGVIRFPGALGGGKEGVFQSGLLDELEGLR